MGLIGTVTIVITNTLPEEGRSEKLNIPIESTGYLIASLDCFSVRYSRYAIFYHTARDSFV